MNDTKTPYGSAVIKAGAILGALSSDDGPKTVTEISRDTGISKATVYKLLETLQLMGLVERTPFTTYKLGVGVVRLARSYLSEQNGLAAIAEPYLRQLNELTGETIHLGLQDGLEIVYLVKLESTQVVRMHSNVGQASPMYCTGLGKAILSSLDDSNIEDYLKQVELHRYTSTTITKPELLRLEVQRIRKRGYAMDNGEHSEDVRCIAVAFPHNRKQWAAISISAPLYRMEDATIQAYAPHLLKARSAILRVAQSRPG